MDHSDFSTLSPPDFEELVRDLLQAEGSIRLESFGPGRDQGVDFRFSQGGHTLIVQAKHYPSGFSALLKNVKDEDAKVARLRPQRYILATSVSMNVERKAKLIAALPSAPLVEGDVLGREDLNAMLARHPTVKRNHFKLWMGGADVLDRIVHSSLYNRTAQEFADIERLVPLFVTNDSVPAAFAILEKQGVLIVSGEPGVGKSTLAQMIVLGHAKSGWNVTVVDDVNDVFKLGDEREPHLVFFDDFLGQVGLTADWVRTVDQRLPPFLRKARENPRLRFVMTTREYLLRYARQQSERLDAPNLRLAEFVLDVGVYTRSIKARILFNHIYFSKLDPVDRDALIADEFYFKVINHKNYNPRIVSIMTSLDYRELDDSDIRTAFIRVLDDPSVLWDKPYRKHIDPDGRALVLALLVNQRFTDRDALSSSFARVSHALGASIPSGARTARYNAALRALEGSFIGLTDKKVRFANPGVRDYLERVVVADGQLVPIIAHLETFDELSTAWDIWTRAGGVHTLDSRKAWGQAAGPAIAGKGGAPLSKVALLLAMEAALSPEDGAILFSQALDLLQHDDLDESEIEVFESVIGRVASALTATPDSELADRALDLLTFKGAELLRERGAAMPLDMITGLATTLQDHGFDAQIAITAGRDGLNAFLEDLTDTLGEISNHAELIDFESDLKAAVSEWGASHPRMESRLRDRETELLDRHGDDGGEGGWRPPVSAHDISDDGIRSMFAGLRDS
jgi:hypothetical protein